MYLSNSSIMHTVEMHSAFAILLSFLTLALHLLLLGFDAGDARRGTGRGTKTVSL